MSGFYTKQAEARREALARGKAIIDTALAEKRDLTTSERAVVDAALEEVKAIDKKVEGTKRDEALFKAFNNQGPIGSSGTDGLRFLNLKMSPAALRSALGLEPGQRINSKALITGVTTLPVGTDGGPIVGQPRPAGSLLEVIPAEEVDSPPFYGYLAQGPRNNSAAPVAPGGTKPTTAMSLARQQGRLKVIAHLSEPVDRFMLEDFSNLAQFVQDELGMGVRDALIGQLLAGDGTGENLTGLASLSGIQTQAFDTDAVTSVRAAFTSLEALGLTPSAVAMSPASWAAIETSRTTSNGFILSPDGPVDAVTRRLYGVPVVVVPQLAAGVAWVLSEGSLVIKHDRHGIRVDWGVVNDSFAKNEVIGRAEGRFDLAALRPAGIVHVSLAAA